MEEKVLYHPGHFRLNSARVRSYKIGRMDIIVHVGLAIQVTDIYIAIERVVSACIVSLKLQRTLVSRTREGEAKLQQTNKS